MNFQNDYIMRQIEGMTAFLSQLMFGRETASELFDEEGNVTDEGLLFSRLRAMIARGEVNEAENALFFELEGRRTEPMLSVAKLFYSELNALTDEQLERARFSRAEILDGLESVKQLFTLERLASDDQ